MKEKKQAARNIIYQLRISLENIKPTIWRRFLVSGDVSLRRLHNIIQAVMGWENYHLHMYVIEDIQFGRPDPDGEMDMKDDSKIKLGHVTRNEGYKFSYTYDFGDNWRHEIEVEKITSPESGARYPVCVGGERACPPEDCGGVYGFSEMLEIIHDPGHEEHKSTMEWLGGGFDPKAFDKKKINGKLKRLK